ncbi:MAG: gliding motility-associated ABC transporter ATP-binding subunit GldA [Bacteroidota bacterium]
MSIVVKEVTRYYGTQAALKDVSFSLKPGEITGFIGPNGAGKSTMMKIITGYLPPSSGEVEINGINVLKNSLGIRRITGYLPENNPLYLNMYVKEYLTFVAGLYGIKHNVKDKVKEMIHLTGLDIEQNKQIGSLSKGYRQRVGLAQALLHDPEILVLDEPTSGLDPNQIIGIRNLISEVGKDKTVMLSTHIMQEVEAICDHIIIIDRGKIVADAHADDLKSGLDNFIFQVEFGGEVDIEMIQKVPGSVKVHALKENTWLIESEAGNDIRENIFSFAVKNNLTVLSLQKREKSLEEIFQELTRE